ncbi:hypothetical protein [Burkholderia pseudomultivorans]|uniref:hypothetical protein n=1 Tax=Burkholderia pseudomultivorans TaxID=1207504 RepID=UPI00287B7429|nr:hypothetical protein [Burkholderia pseudomultivorans]
MLARLTEKSLHAVVDGAAKEADRHAIQQLAGVVHPRFGRLGALRLRLLGQRLERHLGQRERDAHDLVAPDAEIAAAIARIAGREGRDRLPVRRRADVSVGRDRQCNEAGCEPFSALV